MKIIHCADIHLDSKMETNLTAKQASERRYEILASFEDMIEHGKKIGAKVIIIAGDMFDTSENIQLAIKKRALEAIERAKDIDFLYLQGNHDNNGYFQSLKNIPSNLKFFGTDWISYEYGDVVISGVEFGSFNENRIYSELRLDHNKVNIVTMHGQYVSSGKDVEAGHINLTLLKDRGIDYLALGHLHQYQAESLDTRGVFCYSGCLEGRGYDECGPKGYVIVDVEEGIVNHQFLPTSRREIHNISVDVTNEDERSILIKSMESVQDIPSKDYVKVTLVGEIGEEVNIDLMYLEKRLGERYYSFKIQDKTSLEIDFNKYANDISLKGEFIRKVELLELPDEEKRKIILTGLQALAGKGGL